MSGRDYGAGTWHGYKVRRLMGWPRRCAMFGCRDGDEGSIWVTHCRRCGRRYIPRGRVR